MNAKPKLRIGIPGDYLPFGIINEDSPLGFVGHDVDLAAELCREAGLAPLFVLTTWPTFMTDLAEGVLISQRAAYRGFLNAHA